MKKAFQIFKRDIKRLFHNRAALLIVIGVCILPSLYAWFNIAANMDPYVNTAGIKIAIANEDTGADSKKLSLNAGNTIVSNLKENDQLGWTFVDRQEAIEGVKSGEYYAAIIIPKDFSSSLLSVLSGKIESPQLDYYINEKKNAIAPKFTDSGATTVQQEINDTFSSVAAQTISEIIQGAAKDLTGDVNKLNIKLDSNLADVKKNIAQYQKVLKDFESTTKDSTDLIDDTVDTLDDVKRAAASGNKSLSDTSSLLKESRSYAGDFSSTFSENLSDGQTVFGDIYQSVSEKLGNFESKAGKADTTIKSSITSIEDLTKKNTQILDSLLQINANLNGDDALSATINEEIAKLQKQNASLQELLTSLKSGSSGLENALNTAKNTTKELKSLSKKNKKSLKQYKNSLNKTILPGINNSLDSLSTLSATLSATLSNISPTVDQMKLILKQLGSSLSDTSSALSDTSGVLDTLDEELGNISSDLKALQSSSVYEKILSLRGLDADSISDFMSSPVEIKSETMYSVKNYGSGMTPFYTNLALWVGGLILVSIFKQEVDKDEEVSHFSPTSAYMGRWMLYAAVGLVQGFIVCAGDILLLGVQCIHPVLFTIAGMICSFIYVSLIYALAITLKHIGKALCVVLIILQIPGSSGTFPIEMTPGFFQILHPLLPFTYGINAMRECIAGMYGNYYIKNLLILAIFIPIAFFIGLLLRPALMNLNHLFDKKLAESDLMLCETETGVNEKGNISLMLKVLMRDEKLKEEFINRAAKFEKRYPVMIRSGFLCMLIIPLIFLILMFSLNSKLVFLILWIVSLIILSLYLISLEYFHDKMVKQLALTGLTPEELVEEVKEKRREVEEREEEKIEQEKLKKAAREAKKQEKQKNKGVKKGKVEKTEEKGDRD